MVDPKGVLERRYAEVYASLHAQLQERRQSDAAFGVDDLRGFLKDAYIRQGNDWIGHGPLFDATQSAIIAAYEAVLAEWLADIANESEP